MTDLSALIPPHEPSEDTLATVGGMALDAIPLLGPLAGRALDHALATRERERRHEFDRAIVGELQRLAEQTDQALTVADVVSSDEFLATLALARREAAETASANKRQRLARAAAEAGPWSEFDASERAAFLRLVTSLEDLHIALLARLNDREAWKVARAETPAPHPNDVDMGPTLSAVLGTTPADRANPIVSDAIGDALANLGMHSLTTGLVTDGYGFPFAPGVTDRGERFLAYLSEESPADPAPPAA